MSDPPLAGMLGLVVGANGYAPAFARALNIAGADVAVASATTEAEDMLASRQLARSLRTTGTRSFAQGWDVTLPTNIQVGLRQVTKEFGRPPAIVVYAADVPVYGPLTKATDGDIGRALQANLAGAIYLARSYAREVGPDGGGNLAILLGVPSSESERQGAAAYAAARAGLGGLVRALRSELVGRLAVYGLRPVPTDGGGSTFAEVVVGIATGREMGDHGLVDVQFEAEER